jgi:hypothetical protein
LRSRHAPSSTVRVPTHRLKPPSIQTRTTDSGAPLMGGRRVGWVFRVLLAGIFRSVARLPLPGGPWLCAPASQRDCPCRGVAASTYLIIRIVANSPTARKGRKANALRLVEGSPTSTRQASLCENPSRYHRIRRSQVRVLPSIPPARYGISRHFK